MIPYRIQEADLEIPDSWSDQTINIFKIPANENHGEASLVISRDTSRGKTSFHDYVTGQIETAKKQLPGFKLFHREDFDLRGNAASSVRYSWSRDGLDLMLCQVFVENVRSVLILTLTTTPEDASNHAAAWKEIIRSYRPVTVSDPSHTTSSPENP